MDLGPGIAHFGKPLFKPQAAGARRHLKDRLPDPTFPIRDEEMEARAEVVEGVSAHTFSEGALI